jgi:preprotein translocase subunit SecG
MIDQFLNASLAIVLVVLLIWVVLIQTSGFTLNQFF